MAAHLSDNVTHRSHVLDITSVQHTILDVNTAIYYCLLFPVGILGNLFTISAVIMVLKINRNIPNFLIGVLSANDLASILFIHTITVAWMINGGLMGGVQLCYFQSMMAYSYFKFGFLTKCCICLDRYIAVAAPLRYTTLITFKRMLFLTIHNIFFSIGSSLLTQFIGPQQVGALRTSFLCLNDFSHQTSYLVAIITVEGLIFWIGIILFCVSNFTLIKVRSPIRFRSQR